MVPSWDLTVSHSLISSMFWYLPLPECCRVLSINRINRIKNLECCSISYFHIFWIFILHRKLSTKNICFFLKNLEEILERFKGPKRVWKFVSFEKDKKLLQKPLGSLEPLKNLYEILRNGSLGCFRILSMYDGLTNKSKILKSLLLPLFKSLSRQIFRYGVIKGFTIIANIWTTLMWC